MNELAVEQKNRISDDILLEVYDYIRIEDLFRWLTVSTQFTECIQRSLNTRKFITFGKNYGFGCVPDYNCYLRYYSRVNSSRDQIDTHNSNIELGLHFDSKYYYISRSLDTLNHIFIKCSQIRCLGLNHCYLDEQSFEILDQNLSQLEILLIFKCFLEIGRLEDLSQKMRSLSNNITNLTLFENYKNTGQELIKFALMFKCLTILQIDLEKRSASIQLLEQLPLSLKVVNIYSRKGINITDHEFTNDFNNNICSHLESIFINTLIISNEALNNMILSMNLKEISFNCIELNEQFLMKIVNRWKGLTYLGINRCNFVGDFNCMERVHSSLKHLLFCGIGLNPNQLKSVMKSFQNIKTIFLYIEETKIRCIADELKQNCKLCFNTCYEIFPRLDSLRKLNIYFDDIRKSFFRCLKDFPNLRLLKIRGRYVGTQQEVIDSYEEHLSHILVYLINTCSENPKKCLRLELTEKSTKLPNSLKIPKNLLIVKGKIY